MFDAFLVTWRELAEVLLIIALMRQCLFMSGEGGQQARLIKRGMALAVVWLCACMATISFFASDPVFNALLTIAAAIGVSLMAMGMAVSAGGIQRKLSYYTHHWLEQARAPALVVGLVSLLILREGLEMFILLRAIASLQGLFTMLMGAALGTVAAGLTTRIWAWVRARFGLLIVFRVSAMVLVLLAARLCVQGCLALLQARWLPIDHDHWLPLATRLLDDGQWSFWLYGAVLCLPLFYFLRSWWREAEFVDPDRERDASPFR